MEHKKNILAVFLTWGWRQQFCPKRRYYQIRGSHVLEDHLFKEVLPMPGIEPHLWSTSSV